MKRKQLIISFVLMVTVLFSMLFQSIHSYEHLVAQRAAKECFHQHNKYNHTELTHQHQVLELCDVCHFSFHSYISPEQFFFQTLTFQTATPYFAAASEIVFSFSGSMYAHRGPPVV